MEKMPYQPELDRPVTAAGTVSSDWSAALPLLVGSTITLRL